MSPTREILKAVCLTETRLFNDYRKKSRTNYIAVPVRTTSPEKLSRDSGYAALFDYPRSRKEWVTLTHDFAKNHTKKDPSRKTPGGYEWWEKADIWPSLAVHVNHQTKTVDVDLEHLNAYRHRRQDPGSDKSSFTIAGPNSEFAENKLEMQKVLKLVVQLDPPVANFEIIGTDTFNGLVKEFIESEDQAQKVLQKTAGELVMYHGTSLKRWQRIKRVGLTPGNSDGYSDLVPGYSDGNIYLASSKETARNYAARAAINDASTAVVLKVTVRDFTKIIPDEDSMNWLNSTRAGKLRRKGENDTHFKHWNWKEMTPEKEQLLKLWHSNGEFYRGSIAYRGSIKPQDIQAIQSFTPIQMSRDPDGEEFAKAMSKTAATVRSYGGPGEIKDPEKDPEVKPVKAKTGGRRYRPRLPTLSGSGYGDEYDY